MYEIIAVPDDAPVQYEQMGTKSKFWFNDANGSRVLFKVGRPGTGENWAEKVCCEICGLLDLPHAQYDLAIWKGQSGVISPMFLSENDRLVLGNELLAGVDKYDAERKYKVREHTVRLVLAVTDIPNLRMPLGCNVPEVFTSPSDYFVGYLMLDALVSNQDRHHENWGLVIGQGRDLYLAPTFDHAASLGRNESDKFREECLTTKDKGRTVEAYVQRARSALYKTSKSQRPLTTLEAFIEAARFRVDAVQYWLEVLNNLSFADIENILALIPASEMSDQAKAFSLKMMQINAIRLLNSGV